MSTARPDGTFRATRGLGYLAGLAASGLALSGLYVLTGQGLPCPFRMATGWDCPFCGGTRLGAALLHGDLAAAFLLHPVLLVGLVVLTVLGVLWTVEALGGPAVRLPARVVARVRSVPPTRRLVAGLAATAAFVLLRNLL